MYGYNVRGNLFTYIVTRTLCQKNITNNTRLIWWNVSEKVRVNYAEHIKHPSSSSFPAPAEAAPPFFTVLGSIVNCCAWTFGRERM